MVVKVGPWKGSRVGAKYLRPKQPHLRKRTTNNDQSTKSNNDGRWDKGTKVTDRLITRWSTRSGELGIGEARDVQGG